MPEPAKYVPGSLPATIGDAHYELLVGKEVLRAKQAELRAIDKVPEAKAAKVSALQTAQHFANYLLDVEVVFGELLDELPPKRAKGSSSQGTSLPSLPANITKKESHQAQTLARHPTVVEMVNYEGRGQGRPHPGRDRREQEGHKGTVLFWVFL